MMQNTNNKQFSYYRIEFFIINYISNHIIKTIDTLCFFPKLYSSDFNITIGT